MHTKPKQGTPFRQDRAKLMNCPVHYDDDIERANTHPSLLPESGVQTSAIGSPKTPNHRGSVLRNKHKVSIPDTSQTPGKAATSYHHTKVVASGNNAKAAVTAGHQLPKKLPLGSRRRSVRWNSTVPRSRIASTKPAKNHCLPKRYGHMASSLQSSLFC